MESDLEQVDDAVIRRHLEDSLELAPTEPACRGTGAAKRLQVQSTRRVRMSNFPKGTLASLSFALRP